MMDIGSMGYDEERMLLKRYLSDEIAPMIFANNASEIFEIPSEVVAAEIQSWVGDQISGASNMTVGDLLHHAASKIHQLGVLELIPHAEVREYIDKLRPQLLRLCPQDQRDILAQSFSHLEKSTAISASKSEILYKQGPGVAGGHPGAPDGARGVPGPPGAASAAASAAESVALHRLNLLLDRLPQANSLGAAPGKPGNEVLAHVVEDVASRAGSAKELETQLGFLKDLGVENLGPDIIRTLSKSLPDWAPPSHENAPGADSPASAARAMRKVVKLSKDKNHLKLRFKELVGVAIDEFNQGSLGRAVTMLDLAERMMSRQEVDASISGPVIEESYPNLDQSQLDGLAEDADKRLLLHRLMQFFPKLRVDGLLESLKNEQDEERRLSLLKLLRTHGDDARAEAVNMLGESIDGSDRQPWYVLRNLVYLMKSIPRSTDEDIDHEIDLLIHTSDLRNSAQVVRESLATLVALDSPRAYATLDARISELEDVLMGESTARLNEKEVRWLLGNLIKQLSQNTTTGARSCVISHGLKGHPELGDTYARLAGLGTQDLSSSPAQLGRILEALKRELPRRFLGVSVKNERRSQMLEHMIRAISGTESPEVQKLLRDIGKKYSEQTFGRLAEEALSRMGGQAAKKRRAEKSATLTGDLALFGIPNLLQNLADTGVTGTLRIINADGSEVATLELASGDLTAAKAGLLTDEVAVYQLLERPVEGSFAFENASNNGESQPSAQNSRSVMSLLMEGMRRYDEFNRALALVPDDARFKAVKKPTDVKEDADPKLAKAVWDKASRGTPPSQLEPELGVDSYRVRRLYEHWVTEGSLAPVDDEG